MNKHDLKRELGPLYQTSAETPVRVEVPAFNAAPEKWKTVIRQPIASPGAQAMG